MRVTQVRPVSPRGLSVGQGSPKGEVNQAAIPCGATPSQLPCGYSDPIDHQFR